MRWGVNIYYVHKSLPSIHIRYRLSSIPHIRTRMQHSYLHFFISNLIIETLYPQISIFHLKRLFAIFISSFNVPLIPTKRCTIVSNNGSSYSDDENVCASRTQPHRCDQCSIKTSRNKLTVAYTQNENNVKHRVVYIMEDN